MPFPKNQKNVSPTPSITYLIFSHPSRSPPRHTQRRMMNLDETYYALPDPSAPFEPTICIDPADCQEDRHDPEPSPKKRNCGRCGPKSPEGKRISANNATRHGSCALTLILFGESEEGWLRLLHRWVDEYKPRPDSLEYDFVLKTAQTEWHRIRNQRNYDDLLTTLGSKPPLSWTPEETKQHDLHHRYRRNAESDFARTYRLLEQHYKTHKPECFEPASAPVEPKPMPRLSIVKRDRRSPTGKSLTEHPPREGVAYPLPYEPPPEEGEERLEPPK